MANSVENMSGFKYFGTAVRSQNEAYIQEETKG
jgi:hypothetical protein